jgi:hypothetical protein
MSQPSDTLEYRVQNYLTVDDFHEAIREMLRGLSGVQSGAEFGKIRNEIKELIADERRIRISQTLGTSDRPSAQRELELLKDLHVALAANIDKLVGAFSY